jgi:class 3 adenylate cyclase
LTIARECRPQDSIFTLTSAGAIRSSSRIPAACLAALGVQEEAKRLAVGVQDRDGVELQLRIGLNSGQVIAGEMGSGPFGYTAVGEQVGMAQRMESVAPPGGVMLSVSTARLVDGAAALGTKAHQNGRGTRALPGTRTDIPADRREEPARSVEPVARLTPALAAGRSMAR